MNCDEIESEYVLSKFKMSKKRRNRKKVFAVFLVIFSILFLVFLYFHNTLNPLILYYGEAEVEKLLVSASNEAILDVNSVSYDNLIQISYASDNTISSIVCNGSEINVLSNSLVMNAQNRLDENARLGINIPIGTLTGISFLIGKGSNVNFAVNPIGSVKCTFNTSFTSAGINQTSHKIYALIECEASLILPFQMKKINTKIEYLISEFLIVGKVPDTYLNITSLNDLIK